MKDFNTLFGVILIAMVVIFVDNLPAQRGNCVDVDPPEFVFPTPQCGSYFIINFCSVNNFTVRVTDNSTSPITLTVSGLPTNASMNPPLPFSANPVESHFSWFANTTTGPITFTATDSCGNQSSCIINPDFPLSDPPQPPYFQAPTPVCGSSIGQSGYGKPISFPVHVFDGNWYDSIKLTSTSLPPGATMNPPLPLTGYQNVTSIFTWTPTSGQTGNYSIYFTANDLCSLHSECRISFEVILPVELSSFTFNVTKNDVTLSWTTVSESNNARFEIQRAVAGLVEWKTVGTIGGNGNSSSPISYTYNDRGLAIGSYSYRLKQVDFNGNTEYHILNGDVVIVTPSKFELSQNYPNPFNPVTKIDFEIPADGKVSLNVYDMSGKLVSTLVNNFRAAGYYSEVFNEVNIASGVYYYKLQYSSNGQSFEKTMKMVVLK